MDEKNRGKTKKLLGGRPVFFNGLGFHGFREVLPIISGLIVHGFLEDLDIGNIVLAQGEFLCLEDVLSFLPDGNATVLVPDFNSGGLLVILALKEDGGDLGREEAVL